MKKFLKIFIIVLLVLAVIGGTIFFFFKKHKKENITTGSIANFLLSDNKNTLTKKFLIIDEHIISKDEPDNRMDILIETNEKLDDIMLVLVSYYAESGTSIENKEINKKLLDLKEINKKLIRMSEEYSVKSGYFINEQNEVEFNTTYFDEHLGLNDLYIETCSYLVQYAKLLNMINNTLNVDKISDIKFNMFEIYANIVISTFDSTSGSTETKTRVQIEDDENINTINSILKIRNLNIVKIENENTQFETFKLLVTENNNEFAKHYNNCNKQLFADDFAYGWESTASPLTNEEKAMKYLKLIYGI